MAPAPPVPVPKVAAEASTVWNKLTTFGKFLVVLAFFTGIWIVRMVAEKGFEVVESSSNSQGVLAQTAAGQAGMGAAVPATASTAVTAGAAKPEGLKKRLRG